MAIKDRNDIRGLQQALEMAYSVEDESDAAANSMLLRQKFKQIGGEMSTFDTLEKGVKKARAAWLKKQQEQVKKPEYVGAIM